MKFSKSYNKNVLSIGKTKTEKLQKSYRKVDMKNKVNR